MKYTPYHMKDVHDASSQNKFKVISTFAGGGGSSTGYRLSGGKILCINEFVEEARTTYAENYPDTPIMPDDIKELTGEDILKVANISQGELDILDGSPPCSAFSVAGSLSHNIHEEERVDLFGDVTVQKVSGKHSDGWGKVKNYSDDKKVENIVDLFFEFLRIAKDIQPKVIVGENVKGLTIGEAKQYYHKITNGFEDIEYDVSSKVLNAKNFGVPQTRTRVFFIGIRKDITSKAGLSFMNIASVFPNENKDIVTLEEGLEGLEIDQEETKMLRERWQNTAYYKATTSLMPDDPKKVLSGDNYGKKGKHFNVKRASRFAPASTTTAMGSGATNAGMIHWNEQRKMTIKELKRITSLPDDFKLTGTFNQQAERCGRMVPCLMMKAIGDSIYNEVLSKL